MELPAPSPIAAYQPAPNDRIAAAREAALQFEAVFLAEMLKHTGVGSPRKMNGGGAGEQAFASYLTSEYAMRMARTGGVGLAAVIEAQILRAGGLRD